MRRFASLLVMAATFPGTDMLRLSDPAGSEAANPAISQDKRWARLVAFEQDGQIQAIQRAQPYGDDGSPWAIGDKWLISVASQGVDPNGPSHSPSVDGTSRVAPHCVAFVSSASNLVAGDTNGKPDAFVRDMRTGRTIRVSVDSRGRQSNGSVTEVAINGLCTRVAFVSDGGDLALTSTRNRSWKSAVTRRPPAGVPAVYMRSIGGSTGLDRALKGLTFLASADGRVPMGPSHSIAFSTNARALHWVSEGGAYQRVMVRRYGRKVKGRSPQYLSMRTNRLATGVSQIASNVDGSVVAFVRGGQVFQLRPGGSPKLVSRTDSGAPGNGPSANPTLTAGGTWVIFDSAASDVADRVGRKPDSNGVSDIQLFTEVSGERWILGEKGSRAPASDPMTSPHGNYVVFERAGHAWMVYVGPK